MCKYYTKGDSGDSLCSQRNWLCGVNLLHESSPPSSQLAVFPALGSICCVGETFALSMYSVPTTINVNWLHICCHFVILLGLICGMGKLFAVSTIHWLCICSVGSNQLCASLSSLFKYICCAFAAWVNFLH